jgi:hypothetical protein
VQQLDTWVTDEMTAVDPSHLLVTPMMCERIGRHVLSLAAAILERKLMTSVVETRKSMR